MVDSPAYRSLLRVGDRVLAVNDVSIDDLSHEKIVECIRKSGQRLRLLPRVHTVNFKLQNGDYNTIRYPDRTV